MGDTTINVSFQVDNTGALILDTKFHMASIMRPRLFDFVRILLSVGSIF